jgi:hypothetical protein
MSQKVVDVGVPPNQKAVGRPVDMIGGYALVVNISQNRLDRLAG